MLAIFPCNLCVQRGDVKITYCPTNKSPLNFTVLRWQGGRNLKNLKKKKKKMYKALCFHFPTANIYLAIPMLVYALIHISSFFRD